MSQMTSFSPGLILILGAVPVPFLRGVWRKVNLNVRNPGRRPYLLEPTFI